MIYVYNYHTKEEVTSIEAHDSDITSLDVHPTDPLVLSSSEDHLIKLWNWRKKNWKCIRTFEGHSDRVKHVNFNPMDTNSFATASLDHTIKVWLQFWSYLQKRFSYIISAMHKRNITKFNPWRHKTDCSLLCSADLEHFFSWEQNYNVWSPGRAALCSQLHNWYEAIFDRRIMGWDCTSIASLLKNTLTMLFGINDTQYFTDTLFAN